MIPFFAGIRIGNGIVDFRFWNRFQYPESITVQYKNRFLPELEFEATISEKWWTSDSDSDSGVWIIAPDHIMQWDKDYKLDNDYQWYAELGIEAWRLVTFSEIFGGFNDLRSSSKCIKFQLIWSTGSWETQLLKEKNTNPHAPIPSSGDMQWDRDFQRDLLG